MSKLLNPFLIIVHNLDINLFYILCQMLQTVIFLILFFFKLILFILVLVNAIQHYKNKYIFAYFIFFILFFKSNIFISVCDVKDFFNNLDECKRLCLMFIVQIVYAKILIKFHNYLNPNYDFWSGERIIKVNPDYLHYKEEKAEYIKKLGEVLDFSNLSFTDSLKLADMSPYENSIGARYARVFIKYVYFFHRNEDEIFEKQLGLLNASTLQDALEKHELFCVKYRNLFYEFNMEETIANDLKEGLQRNLEEVEYNKFVRAFKIVQYLNSYTYFGI